MLPRDNATDDDDDDDNDGDSSVGGRTSVSSEFIDMNSGRVAARRNLGLRSRVRRNKTCNT